MIFTEPQKQYLISLVKTDLEVLEQLAGDDPKNWKTSLTTARATMSKLCGGCGGDCKNCKSCGGTK